MWKKAIARGFRKKCPRCGKGELFLRWFTLHPKCEFCGLEFEPAVGDTWFFWTIGDRIFVIIPMAAFYFGFLPETLFLKITGFTLILAALLWTMPHRMGVCVALDYLARLRFGDLFHQSSRHED